MVLGSWPGDCRAVVLKKLNQSLTKFYPGIPDIGGQETCFLPVKKKKTAEGQTGELRLWRQSSGINRKN